MILFPHMLVGAALGAKIQNLWFVFIFAVGLHFLFDRLPHWEYGQKLDLENVSKKTFFLFFLKALADFTVGGLIICLLWQNSFNLYYTLFGALAGLLPDIIIFLRLFTKVVLGSEIKIFKKFYLFHTKIHISKTRNSPLWGIIVEGSAVILAIYLLLT